MAESYEHGRIFKLLRTQRTYGPYSVAEVLTAVGILRTNASTVVGYYVVELRLFHRAAHQRQALQVSVTCGSVRTFVIIFIKREIFLFCLDDQIQKDSPMINGAAAVFNNPTSLRLGPAVGLCQCVSHVEK